MTTNRGYSQKQHPRPERVMLFNGYPCEAGQRQINGPKKKREEGADH